MGFATGRFRSSGLLSMGCYASVAVLMLMPFISESATNSTLVNKNFTLDAIIPDIIINGTDGRPCFLGDVNLTVEITYDIPFDDDKTNTNDVTVPLNGNVTVGGDCGDIDDNATTVVTMTWPDDILQLNFTFQVNKTDKKPGELRWSLIALSLRVSSEFIPEGALGENADMYFTDNGTLFDIPIGLSFLCGDINKMWRTDNNREIVVHFNKIHLQAFDVKDYQFSETYVCKTIREKEVTKKENYIVPIIVGCCLASIVAGVVIGYAITRRVNKYREQSEYKPM